MSDKTKATRFISDDLTGFEITLGHRYAVRGEEALRGLSHELSGASDSAKFAARSDMKALTRIMRKANAVTQSETPNE
jgi:hypothetical protein